LNEPNGGVRAWLSKNPLPPREEALDAKEIKEGAALDDKTRVFRWATTTAAGKRAEFEAVAVAVNSWWAIDRVSVKELEPATPKTK
jgi:hypothetical protein